MAKTLQLDIFPPELQELNREVLQHPELMQELANCGGSMEERIAAVATYCGIQVDGYFSLEGINALCKLLVSHLRSHRIIVVSSSIH